MNQYVHVAEVTDPGQTWPDQLEEKVDVAVTHQWGFEQAKRCKGEGAVKVIVPESPFEDSDAFGSWRDRVLGDLEKTEVNRRQVISHDSVPL